MTHVLAATILHEANSFARTPAPLSHFERQGVFLGEAVQHRFSQTRTEMAGFLAAVRGEAPRPVVTGEEAARALDLALAVEQAVQG